MCEPDRQFRIATAWSRASADPISVCNINVTCCTGFRANRLASFKVGRQCIRAVRGVQSAQRQHKGRTLAPFSSHQSWDGGPPYRLYFKLNEAVSIRTNFRAGLSLANRVQKRLDMHLRSNPMHADRGPCSVGLHLSRLRSP